MYFSNKIKEIVQIEQEIERQQRLLKDLRTKLLYRAKKSYDKKTVLTTIYGGPIYIKKVYWNSDIQFVGVTKSDGIRTFSINDVIKIYTDSELLNQ
jgi:hypothetical protein